MPIIGEIKKEKEHNYIWQACESCGKERWVVIVKGKARFSKCQRCAHSESITKRNKERTGIKWDESRKAKWRAENNPAWIDGRRYLNGYVIVTIQPDNPYYPMSRRKGVIFEHRLIMAQQVGRCLARNEDVHHKNGIKDDNRIENLELVSRMNHLLQTTFCDNCELKKEIRLLRLQQKILFEQIREMNLVHMEIR